MIIQNGQPRNYALCNGRNVAMLRGGQWIIKPMPLSLEVKSQIYADILDASLANEVWRAANLYCKAHQQAHPELTSQGKLLSTFVNNDPDMYASLPLTATPAALSAMPKRWLDNGGSAYINTMLYPTDFPVIMESEMKFNVIASERDFFGNWNSGGFEMGVSNGNKMGIYANSWWNPTPVLTANTIYKVRGEIDSSVKKLTVNGTEYSTNTNNRVNSTASVAAMSGRGTGYSTPNMRATKWFYKINGVDYYLVPCKDNNTMKWIDINSLNFATLVGTFTEQKDLHNS